MEDILFGISAKDWAQMAQNYVLAASAGVTAWAALRGLSIWKKQENWKENKKLAKSVLKEIYRTREAIRDCRSPIMLTGEMIAATEAKEIDFTKEADLKQSKQSAYVKRFSRITDCLEDIYPLELEAKVVWGDEIPKVLRDFRRIIGELRVALEDSPIFEAYGELSGDELKANRLIIYGRFDENDEFGNRVDLLVREAAKFLEPHLGRPS